MTTLGMPEVHLYGGPNRSVYLGCYNCSSYDSDSICNKYGSHGSKYSSTSVWNQYGTVGSQYSLSSPWNEYSISANVPVLVDANGVSYGYFTINVYRFDAFSEASSLNELYELFGETWKMFRRLSAIRGSEPTHAPKRVKRHHVYRRQPGHHARREIRLGEPDLPETDVHPNRTHVQRNQRRSSLLAGLIFAVLIVGLLLVAATSLIPAFLTERRPRDACPNR